MKLHGKNFFPQELGYYTRVLAISEIAWVPLKLPPPLPRRPFSLQLHLDFGYNAKSLLLSWRQARGGEGGGVGG